jgi:hypothetical protein
MLKMEMQRHSFWQRVFLQSKVNGALYWGEELPGRHWQWPKDTYLQRRLRNVRPVMSNDKHGLN